MCAGWRRAASPPHIRFIEIYDPSLPPVWGNRDQLVQVVLNLVKNAAEAITAAEHAERRDHADHRASSTACGWPCRAPTARLAPAAGGRRCATTGRASPRTSAPTCSIRSSRTKPSGSGLGLALVAKIVGDHGGLIEVDSRPGRTEFRLHLPVLTDETSA